MNRNRKVKRVLINFSFLLPSMLIFTYIILIPLISGVRYTFTDWDGLAKNINFVGLKNYITVFHDKDLIEPIKNTFLFTIVTLVCINAGGLGLAVLVNHEFKGVNIVKSIIFIPLVISLVLTSQMWNYVYSDFFGMLGWESPLINKKTAMLGLCLMSIWKETGLAMIIYLASLKSVPADVEEAAIMDGASSWQRFIHVTIPFIAPAFTYCIPLWLAGGLREFDYSCVATSGGPGNATMSIAYYIYKYLFPYNKVGYGQTVAVLYFIFCLIVSNLVTRWLRRREIEL